MIVAFAVATLLPVSAAMWVASTLIDRSLAYSTIDDVDTLSRMLEDTARGAYQLQRDMLARAASSGLPPDARHTVSTRAAWPQDVTAFWEAGDPQRFQLAGTDEGRLLLMKRVDSGVDVYTQDLGELRMQRLANNLRLIRGRIADARDRDLQRGMTLTLALLISGVWTLSLVPVVLIASRVSRPIRELTASLTDFAAGNWDRAVVVTGRDEVGRAGEAFNNMAAQLRRNRDRLIYLAQMTSWQLLARKTAHEVKNSLTPIRLTVEEMVARDPSNDPTFMSRAAQIVVSEIETLERRVRAFSDFATEPAVRPEPLRVNSVVRDRVSLLGHAHPETMYECELDDTDPVVVTTLDLLKGTLTNLIENAAEAAGPGGRVRIVTSRDESGVIIEVHDSGPGLDEEARQTLFEPTISFKTHGMGLGPLIGRKNALLCGGDITLIAGDLGGAGFRVWIPSRPTADPS